MRELEHTADVGFEIEAGSLDDLFRGAAEGLLGVCGLAPDVTVSAGAEDRQVMELTRPDLERLLVAWLRELTFGIQTGRGAPTVQELSVGPGGGAEDGPRRVATTVRWLPGSEPAREVKAVTYHGLHVVQRAGAWHARVILDV